jgi:hypothetical protein
MAAAGIREDFVLGYAPWHVWGPTAVAVMMAERAVIPGTRKGAERALGIGRRLDRDVTMTYAPAHRLDLAQAHATLAEDDEAVGELEGLWRQRPEWLARQRGAADTLQQMIDRRKRLTDRMAALANALRLPLLRS